MTETTLFLKRNRIQVLIIVLVWILVIINPVFSNTPGDSIKWIEAKELGADGERTVDGTHPTDLGFIRQSDAYELVLKSILQNK